MFNSKTLLITGGTGSFGNAVLDRFLTTDIKEIRILGACVCIEVNDPAVLDGYREFACRNGVFARPFLRYLYAMVPYVITETELRQVLKVMKAWFARG